ncbi:Uncharacterised protein [Mycobacteroides abscessus]|nr:Uncharacterised protein [Mycobacteroides abscessus]
MTTRRRSDVPAVRRPTSVMKIGTRGMVTAMITAETQSRPSTTASVAGVTVAASRSWGRYRTM